MHAERAEAHSREMDAAKAAHEDREELAKAAHVRALDEMDTRRRAALRQLDETQRQVTTLRPRPAPLTAQISRPRSMAVD